MGSWKVVALACALLPVTFGGQAYASGSYPIDAFEIPQGAYEANFIGDDKGVSIIEFSGNYDKTLEGGQFNRPARAVIAQEFYKNHPDEYDFIVTFSSFEFETDNALAFYHGVKNDTQGIGIPLFDQTARYGSNGKLQGFIDMAAMTRYTFDPFHQDYNFTLNVLAHEILHRWGVNVRFLNEQGELDESLLGAQGAHWSFFLDSKASVQYGSAWQLLADGRYRAEAVRQIYSPLDLYLMGFYSADQVPPVTLLNYSGDEYNRFNYPVKGAEISASPITVSIDDIIAAEGLRVPSAANAQKDFKIAFVYLTNAGSGTNQQDLIAIDSFRRAFMERFAILTGGIATLQVYPSAMPVEVVEELGGSAVDETSIRLDEADINDGLNWIEAQQNMPAGNWADSPNTALRDTAIVVSVLNELDQSYLGLHNALNWVHTFSPTNTDSLSRKLLLLPDNAELKQLLANRQNSDGGWGLIGEYASNALDTALALQAAVKSGADVDFSAAIQFLTGARKTDAGWADTLEGVNSIVVTTEVLKALAEAGVTSNESAIDGALAWLANQQQGNGGFGVDQSSVHETASVILTMVSLEREEVIDLAAAVAYLSGKQRDSGSWEGSVYTSALAAHAMQMVNLTNLALTAFEVDKLGKQDGERVKLTVRLKNDSPLNAMATELHFYEGNPTEGGVQIGSAAYVPAIGAGVTYSVSAYWDTTSKEGTTNLYALVDPANSLQERTKVDNILALNYSVIPAPNAVDLEVIAGEFSISPQAPTSLPVQLTASAIVRNVGLQDAANVSVALWRGEPNLAESELIGTQEISVSARASVPLSFFVDLTKAGTTDFYLMADTANSFIEADEENNTAKQTVVTQDAIDLSVTTQDISVGESAVYLFQNNQVAVTINNAGTLPVANVPVVVGALWAGNYTELENTLVNIPAGQSKLINVPWVPNAVGDGVLSVAIDSDNLVAELDENNNTASFNVTVQQLNGVNLSVNAQGLTFAPEVANQGFGATLSAVVKNGGTLPATTISVRFYDGNPETTGVLIGNEILLAELEPGQEVVVERVWQEIQAATTRTVFVVVDAENTIDEFDETDNVAFSALPVNPLFDLAISEGAIQMVPAFPNVNEPVSINLIVSNIGNQLAQNVAIEAYLGNPNEGGVQIGETVNVAELAAQSNTETSFQTSFASDGNFDIYVRVSSESGVTELKLDNNSAAKRVSIQDGTFYVSERFFSPNGDNIKETSEYFFKLDEPDSVSVVVLDVNGEPIKTFEGNYANVSGGHALWDGRTNTGGLANDGEYKFAVVKSNGQQLGLTTVTVDTNRSSVIDAMGTQFEYTQQLNCTIGQTLGNYEFIANSYINQGSAIYSESGENMYFAVGKLANKESGAKFNTGLYSAKSDGSKVKLIFGDTATDNDFSVWGVRTMRISPNEQYLVTAQLLSNNLNLYSLALNENAQPELLASYESRYGLTFLADYGFAPNTNTLFYTIIGVENNRWVLNVYSVELNGDKVVEEVLADIDLGPRNDQYTWPPALLEFNKTGTHLAVHSSSTWRDTRNYGYRDGQTYSSDLENHQYVLNIIELDSMSVSSVEGVPSAFAWHPNGNKYAVGDATKGNVSVYDLAGNQLQYFSFSRQYRLDAEVEYLKSAIPPLYRADGAVLGRFQSITWNPDGSEFVFVFQDIATSFFADLLYQEVPFEADWFGYGEEVEVEQLGLERVNLTSQKGIYHAILGEGVTTKVAEIPQLRQIYTKDLDYVNQYMVVDPVYTSKNDQGVLITNAGLPYITTGDLMESEVRLAWALGSRAFLETNMGLVVGLDNATATRALQQTGRYSQLRYEKNGEILHSFFGGNDQFIPCPGFDNNTGPRQSRSLANITADIRAAIAFQTSGVNISGTATDKNFESYTLEYASVDSPDVWAPVIPRSQQMVINSSITAWSPPAEGSYFLRLTVLDKAGNTREAVTRVATSGAPTITNLFVSPKDFSPNSDGVLDSTVAQFTVLDNVNVSLTVFDSAGQKIRTYTESYTNIGATEQIIWDGRDENGFRVPDGLYRLVLQGYEFYVNVDTQFPEIEIDVRDLFVPAYLSMFENDFKREKLARLLGNSFTSQLTFNGATSDLAAYTPKGDNANGPAWMAVDKRLVFSANDELAIKDVVLEQRDLDGTVWSPLDVNFDERSGQVIFPSVSYLSEGDLSLTDWLTKYYRVRAVDHAGNEVTADVPVEKKRNLARMYSYALEDITYSEAEAAAACMDGVPIWSSRQVAFDVSASDASVRANAGLELDIRVDDESRRLFFNVYESIAENIVNTVLVLVKPDGTEQVYGLADKLGRIRLVLKGDAKIPCFESQATGVLPDEKLSFEVDLAEYNLDTGKVYSAYLKIQDSANNEYVTNPVTVSITPQVRLVLDKKGNANVQTTLDAFSSFELVAQSKSPLIDERYISFSVYETLVEEDFKAVTAGEVVDGRSSSIALNELLACHNYDLYGRFTLASGERVETPRVVLNKPCMDANFGIYPLLPEACNLPATNQLQVRVQPKDISNVEYGQERPALKEFVVYKTDANGVEDVIYNINSPEYNESYVFDIDITDEDLGSSFQLKLIDVNDAEVIKEVEDIPIVTQVGTLQITAPLNDQKLCAIPGELQLENGGWIQANAIELQGDLLSDADHSYSVFKYSGDKKLEVNTVADFEVCEPKYFEALTSRTLSGNWLFEQAGQNIPNCNENKQEINFKTTSGVELYRAQMQKNHVQNTTRLSGNIAVLPVSESGEMTFEVHQYNWAGSLQCASVTVDIDAAVDGVNLTMEPAPEGVNKSYLYSPNGDGVFDTVAWVYDVEEAVTLNVSVYAAELVELAGGKKKWEKRALITNVYENYGIAAGSHNLSWLPSSVPDGTYILEVVAEDTCKLIDIQSVAVSLDTVAPALSFTYPSDSSTLGVVVEPRGSILDANRFSYTLSVEQDGSGTSLASGQSSISIVDGLFGKWNSFGLEGAWNITLTAVDVVGNQSQIFVVANLAEGLGLISGFSADTNLFSPNSDGIKDKARFAFGLTSQAEVWFELFENNELVGELSTPSLFANGANVWTWSGVLAGGQTVPDGEYMVRLNTRVSSGSPIEYADLNISIDTTAPSVNVENLIAGRVGVNPNVAGKLLGQITDTSLEQYTIRLISSPAGASNVIVKSGTTNILDGLLTFPSTDLSANGEYRIAVNATDVAGNSSYNEFALVLDPFAPVINMSLPVMGSVVGGESVNAVGEVIEDNLTNYIISLAPLSALETPVYTQVFNSNALIFNEALSIEAVVDGDYVMSVTATDIANNTATFDQSIKVDRTPPIANFVNVSDGDSVRPGQSITAKIADDNIIEYKLTRADVNTGVSEQLAIGGQNINSSSIYIWGSQSNDGEYVVTLVVTDAAFNTTETAITLFVDATPPLAPVLSVPELEASTGLITLTWALSNSTDVEEYIVYRNGNPVATLSKTTTTWQDSGASEGDLSYQVAAVDKVGLEGKSNSVNAVIDTIAPDTFFTNLTDGERVSGVVSIAGTAHSLGDFSEYTLYHSVDNVETVLKSSRVANASGELFQWSTLGAQEGVIHTLRLEATDLSGNVGTDIVTVLVDNTAPLTPSGLQADVSGSDVNVTWDASLETDILGYFLYRNGKLLNAPDVTIGELTPYALSIPMYVDADIADGAYDYVVIAVDQTGNVSAPSESIRATVETSAPHAVLVNVGPYEEIDNEFFLVASVDDKDVADVRFEYRLEGVTEWSLLHTDSSEPYQYLWDTSSLPFGEFDVRAIAKDTSNNEDASPTNYTVTKTDFTLPASVAMQSIAIDGGTVTLDWQESVEDDFAGYNVYYGPNPNWSGSLLTQSPITESEITLENVPDGEVYFWVKVVDAASNQSITNPDHAIKGKVYSAILDSLWSPLLESSITVSGKVDANQPALTLHVFQNDVELHTYEVIADEEGQFAFTGVELNLGVSELKLTSLNEDGFKGREAVATLERRDAPAQVLNVVATPLENELGVDLNWDENTEDSIFGYNIYKDSASIIPVAPVNDALFSSSLPTSSSYSIANLTDANTSNYWSPTNAVGDLVIDFNEPKMLTSLLLDWQSFWFSPDEMQILVNRNGSLEVINHRLSRISYPAEKDLISFGKPIATDQVVVRILRARNTSLAIRLKGVVIEELQLAKGGEPFRSLADDGFYDYSVAAVDIFGLEGEPGLANRVTLGDVVAPEPVALSVSVSGSDVSLVWEASTSNDVATYRLFRDSNLIAQLEPTATSYTDPNLINGNYNYYVIPVDVVGNIGSESNTVTAEVVLPLPDAPLGLGLQAHTTSLALILSWTNAAEAAEAVRIYRRNLENDTAVLLAELVGSSYEDTAITLGASYEYYVVAVDTLGNTSNQSNKVTGKASIPGDLPSPVIYSPFSDSNSITTNSDRLNLKGIAPSGSDVYLTHKGDIVASTSIASENSTYSLPVNSLIKVGRSATGDVSAVVTDRYNSRYPYVLTESGWKSLRLENSGYRYYMDVYVTGKAAVTLNGDSLGMVDFNEDLVVNEISLYGMFSSIKEILFYDEKNEFVYLLANGFNEKGVFKYDVNSGSSMLMLQAEVDDGSKFSISPSGNSLALLRSIDSQNSELTVYQLTNNNWVEPNVISIEAPFAIDANSDLPWNRAENALLVEVIGSTDLRETYLVDIELGTVSNVLSNSSAHIKNAVWATSERAVVYQYKDLDGNARLVEQNLQSGFILPLANLNSSENITHVVAGADNVIAFGGQASTLTAIKRAGGFKFADVRIDLGNNDYSVYAVGSDEEVSENSDILHVLRNEPEMADLNANVLSSVAISAVDEPTNIMLTYSNLGSATSVSTTALLTAEYDNGEIEILSDTLPVPALTAGQTLTRSSSWVPKYPGLVILTLEVDGESSVLDSNRTNNVHSTSISVADNAAPFVTLDFAEQTSLSMNDSLVATILVNNAGGLFNGVIKARIIDASGEQVDELLSSNVRNLQFGANLGFPVSWRASHVFSGEYRLAVLLEGESGELIASIERAFTVNAQANILVGTNTNLPVYAANSGMRVNSNVMYSSGNTVFSGGTAQVAILSPTGETLQLFTEELSAILPGSSLRLAFDWNTGQFAAGSYFARTEVSGPLISEPIVSIASFTIRESLPHLEGALTLGKSQIGQGESLDVTAAVRNLANADVAAADISVNAVSVVTGERLVEASTSSPVSMALAKEVNFELQMQNLPVGTYRIQLEATVTTNAGDDIAFNLDEGLISIVDVLPPTLTLISPLNLSVVNSADARVELNAVDDSSGIERVSLFVAGVLDRKLVRDTSNTSLYFGKFEELADGSYRFIFTAEDGANNVSEPLNINVTVDNTAPVISVEGLVDGEVLFSSVEPTITVVDPHLVTESISITLNNEPYTIGSVITGDGDYRFDISANDSAGNEAREIILFSIASAEAEISIEGVSDGLLSNQPVSAFITFAGAELQSSSILLNEEPYMSGDLISSQGVYVLKVTATDVNGNIVERKLNFELDFDAPAIPNVISPSNGTTTESPVVDLVVAAEAGSLVTLSRVSGESYYGTASVDSTVSFESIELNEGLNSFELIARDDAGNVSEKGAFEITKRAELGVELQAKLNSNARVLVWAPVKDMRYHHRCHYKHHEHSGNHFGHYDHDAEALVELIGDAYEAAGVEFDVARDSESFIIALRSQRYSVINLLLPDESYSGHMHLRGVALTELRAAVATGSGLMVMATKPYSLFGMQDVLGAKIRGRIHDSDIHIEAEVLPNVYGFSVAGQSLRVDSKGGQSFGKMYFSCGWKSQGSCEQPALIANQYGLGRTVLAPFNFALLDSDANAKQLIIDIFETVSTATNKQVIAETISEITWIVTGLSDGTSVSATQKFDSVFTPLYNSGADVDEDGDIRWGEQVAQDGRVEFSVGGLLSESVTLNIDFYEGDLQSEHLLTGTQRIEIVDGTSEARLASLIMKLGELEIDGHRNSRARQYMLWKLSLLRGVDFGRSRDVSAAIFILSSVIDDLHRFDDEALLIDSSALMRVYQSKWTLLRAQEN